MFSSCIAKSCNFFYWYSPRHNIVLSFMLKQPISSLKDYIPQLQDNIFDEMSFSMTKVLPVLSYHHLTLLLLFFGFYIDHFLICPRMLVMSTFLSGENIIFKIVRWIKHNKGCVCSWFWCDYTEFNQRLHCIFSYTPIIFSFEYIFWGSFSFKVLQFKGGITVSPE